MIGLAVLVALGLGLRLALPELLRRSLESRGTLLLPGELRIGDVDLSLTGGRLRLEGVEVLPAPGSRARPLTLGRVDVAIAWWELPFGRLRAREVAIAEAAADVRRDDSGRIDLLELFGAPALAGGDSAREPEPSGPPTDRPGFTTDEGRPGSEAGLFFRVDRLEVRASRVQLVDEARPGAAPLELDLDELELRDLAGEPGEPVAARVRAALRLAGGSVRIEGELADLTGAPSADLEVSVEALPLRLLLPYLELPRLRELGGTLSAELAYDQGAGHQHRLSGTLGVVDLSIQAMDVEAPILSARELALADTAFEWPEARLRVGELRVREPRLPFDPRSPAELPLLTALQAASPSPEPEDGGQEPALAWSIERAKLAGGELLLDAPEGEMVSVALDLRNLGSTGGEAALRAELEGLGGSGRFEGRLQLEAFGLAGLVKLDGVDLGPLGTAVGGEAARWLRGGELSGSLELSIGALGSAPDAGRLTGALEGEDLLLGEAGAPLRARIASAKATGLAVRLPEGGGPTRVAVERLELDSPELQVERRPPPALAGPEGDAAAATAGAEAGVPETGAGTHVVVGELHLRDGTVGFRDLTTDPFFRASIEDLEGHLREADLTARLVKELELSGKGPSGSSLRADGALGGSGERLEIEVEKLDLRSLNPYATARAIEIRKGTLDLRSRIEVVGDSVRTRNRISVRSLDLGGSGAEALAAAFAGAPLSLAIALLEDPKGQIRVTVPVELRDSSLRLGLGPVVRDAVRAALVGALASPLKLIGAVVPSRRGTVARPEPIPFVPGRAELTPDGHHRLHELSALLASHPRLAADAQVLSTGADVVARRDAVLAERLASPDLALRLATLGEGRTVRGLRDWLAQPEAERDPATLGAEAAELRRELHGAIEIAPDWLDVLGAERVAKLEAVLVGDAGLGGRVTLGGESRPGTDAPPRAELTLRPREP